MGYYSRLPIPAIKQQAAFVDCLSQIGLHNRPVHPPTPETLPFFLGTRPIGLLGFFMVNIIVLSFQTEAKFTVFGKE